MVTRMAAIVAVAILAACQHTVPKSAWELMTPKTKERLFPTDVCAPQITNPYVIEECDRKLAKDGKPPDPRSEDARQRRIADRQRRMAAAAAEQQAHAQCSYQAQMANLSTPGLITGGFFNGIGAGQACEQYYRAIGVMP